MAKDKTELHDPARVVAGVEQIVKEADHTLADWYASNGPHHPEVTAQVVAAGLRALAGWLVTEEATVRASGRRGAASRGDALAAAREECGTFATALDKWRPKQDTRRPALTPERLRDARSETDPPAERMAKLDALVGKDATVNLLERYGDSVERCGACGALTPCAHQTVNLPERCPRCESPAPNLHPAMQSEGEVQPCSHPWHGGAHHNGHYGASTTADNSDASDVLAYLNGETDVVPGPVGADVREIVRASLPHRRGTFTDTEVDGVVISTWTQTEDGPVIETDPDQLAHDVKVDQMTNPAPVPGSLIFVEPDQPVRRLTWAEVSTPIPAEQVPDHRSHSQFETWTDCNLKYRLSRYHAGQDGTPGEVPCWWFVGGGALATCIERVEKQVASAGTEANPVLLDDLWRTQFNADAAELIASNPGVPMSSWTAADKGREGYDWWLDEGAQMLRRWCAWRADVQHGDGLLGVTDWKIYGSNHGPDSPWFGVELALAWVFQGPDMPGGSHKVNWEGKADLVLYSPSLDALAIIDCKAGKKAPADLTQLGEYGHMLARAGARVPTGGVWGAYWHARTGQLAAAPVDVLAAVSWERIEHNYLALDVAELAAAQSGMYLPNTNRWPTPPCGTCGVRRLCPAVDR